jgi:hypothetical protein
VLPGFALPEAGEEAGALTGPHLLVELYGLVLVEGMIDLLYVLPSDASDCQGHPPTEVHPEVLHPLRPYHPAAELALFDLARVDRFLAQFTWSYQVSKVGQFRIANHTYSVGKAHAGQRVDVRFDPHDRHFVFREGQSGKTIKRCPAKGPDVATITGLDAPPVQPSGPIQLSFPW